MGDRYAGGWVTVVCVRMGHCVWDWVDGYWVSGVRVAERVTRLCRGGAARSGAMAAGQSVRVLPAGFSDVRVWPPEVTGRPAGTGPPRFVPRFWHRALQVLDAVKTMHSDFKQPKCSQSKQTSN